METKPSICIITPGQLGSNPRVVKEAQALVDAGYSVRVVCTKIAEFVEPRDQDILAKAKFNVDRISFTNKFNWRIERLRQEVSLMRAKLSSIERVASFAFSPLTRRLTIAATAKRADLYIAHYVAALPAAVAAARRFGTLYAFDAEDFHLGDLPDAPIHDLENRMIRAIEQDCLPDAAYTTAASPGIADAYAREYQIDRPHVILNTFSKTDGPRRSTPKGSMPFAPSLYWFSQTIGPGRGLECAVEALALSQSRPHLYLRGTPSKGYAEALAHTAAELGVAERLHFQPPEAPSEMVHLATKYDIGLVLETGETENRKIALTNKQFTYLLAGLPSVMSDVPAHRAFAQTAAGACYLYKTGSAHDLARTLDGLLSNAETIDQSRERAHRLGQEKFNWENDRSVLLKVIKKVLLVESKSP